MFKRIRIKNIQSHTNSVLDLCPGMNSITGVSDQGKSVIIKALHWLLTNSMPSNFRNRNAHSKTECSIEVTTDNGIIIKRKRTNTDNIYSYEKDLREYELKGFKTNVPDEIQTLLNTAGINCQRQIETFFLLNDSPSEVARCFNRIVQLDSIDLAFSRINKKKLDILANLRHKKEDLKVLQNDLLKYDNIEELEVKILALETLHQSVTGKANAIANITSISRQMKEQESILNAIPDMDMIEEKIKGHECVWKEAKKDGEKVAAIKDIITNINVVEKTLKHAPDIETMEEKINTLESLNNDIVEAKKKLDELNNLIRSINDTESEIMACNKKHQKASEKFDKMMPDICPLCGLSSTYQSCDCKNKQN